MSISTDTSLCFKQLKQRVTVTHVLDAYGLRSSLRQRGNQLCGPCPLHHGDNPTAFRVHTTRGLWHCFTGCGGGDVVDLVRVIENCTHAEAARHLRALAHDLPPAQPVRHSALAQRTPETFRPFRRPITLEHSAPFLQHHKGINVQTATHFEAGLPVCSSFLRGSVAVRLHDLHGQPLGYCGRRLNNEHIRRFGKWRFPNGLKKAQLLYNAHRALPLRAAGIVVVECPWAVMRLTQAGIPAAVALLGTSLSDTHTAWLSAAPTILLMFDGDHAGRQAQRAIRQRLAQATATLHHNLPDGCEPEDLQDNQLAAIVRTMLPSL